MQMCINGRMMRTLVRATDFSDMSVKQDHPIGKSDLERESVRA